MEPATVGKMHSSLVPPIVRLTNRNEDSSIILKIDLSFLVKLGFLHRSFQPPQSTYLVEYLLVGSDKLNFVIFRLNPSYFLKFWSSIRILLIEVFNAKCGRRLTMSLFAISQVQIHLSAKFWASDTVVEA